MNAVATLAAFQKRFGRKILKAEIKKTPVRLKKKSFRTRLWIELEKSCFKEAVKFLCEIHPRPHFAVASGYDIEGFIELNYIFSLNYGSKMQEFCLLLKVRVPTEKPVLPTICDLIPGALICERELQEMLGVKIEGIPDPRRLFLPKEIPKNVYPWRKDRPLPKKLVRNLNRRGERHE